MKKIQFLSAFAIAAIFAMSLVSCEKDEDPKPEDNVSAGGKTLFGDYTQDVTLTANTEYTLKGDAVFKSGTVLTIEEGVTITAVSEGVISYILIEQDAQINAVGTASNPIVMTADVEEAGKWGGLHICGKAPLNVTGGTGESEIGGATYGGNDAADNSGTIKYIRLEYTGTALDPEHESNGVSFYGVGSGTTVEYVQVYKGADDGYEFFGGTVNVKYVVSTDSEDDSFDWTEGWSGKGQYMIAVQNVKGDRGIEGDNNGNNNTATPYATPMLSQVTLIGCGSLNEDGYGMKLREGTKGKFVNIVVGGFYKRSIHVEHNQTLLNVADNSLKVDYAVVDTNVSDASIKYSVSKVENPNYDPNDPDSEEEIDDPSQAAQDAKTNAKANGFEKSANVTLTSIDGNAATQYDGGVDASTLDAFFTADTKIGAGTSWTNGWVK